GLAFVIQHHHVGDVDRRLLRDDPPRLGTAPAGLDLGVLLDPVDALDQHLVLTGVGGDHLAACPPVLAGDDDNHVVLLDLHSTSGASEMIFMKRLSRSSRPTGPKIRVPRGSPLSRSSTAAFSSNRM